ncbi:hypothetical protein [Pandoraea communis]|uniref:hypothetical protein n=1 Tax=Pandoraea communis TaxID=2508297 RepID=UPI0025A56D8D|nr:hypothetical protein [Pandoraea communis]MDM8356160.1 hypothetical protein [Pandoraea communis]
MTIPGIVDERSHPNHWHNRASDLHASAGAIWHAMNHSTTVATDLGLGEGFSMGVACNPIYHMLCGLALELVMKATLVKRGVAPADLQTHSFDKLIDLLGIQVTKKERKLLHFYEASLVWAGRYPIPNKATDEALIKYWDLAGDILSEPVKTLGSLTLSHSSGTTNWENFTKLWTGYSAMFYEAGGKA